MADIYQRQRDSAYQGEPDDPNNYVNEEDYWKYREKAIEVLREKKADE
jgi:uncharacterized protein YneR